MSQCGTSEVHTFKLLCMFVNRNTWMVVSSSILAANFLVGLRQSTEWFTCVDMQQTMIAGLLKREPMDGLMRSASRTSLSLRLQMLFSISFENMFTHFDTIHERDRQTDGQTLHNGIGRTMHSVTQQINQIKYVECRW